ncbi:MAG: SMP-30/gluconolactonase/LRE family protein [Actinomycetales bacterium]|nr:SMP-30/gluconolactonase/LRE family protein [Actinomycetales bacterium]
METVATGLAFPEGPVVLPDGSVAVVQMAADLVTVIGPEGRRRDLPCPGGPNGMALEPDGEHVIVCLNGGLSFTREPSGLLMPGIAEDPSARGGLVRMSLATGAVEVLIEPGPDSPASGPNDVVWSPPESPGGEGVWFTDLGRRLADSLEPGALFWRGEAGEVVRAAYPRVGRPNGIALSRDGVTLFVTESLSAQVWSWPVLGPGVLGEPTMVRQFDAPARLDGMAITPNGNLLVATLVIGELTLLSPTGEVLARLEVDDPMPTNVVFDRAVSDAGGPQSISRHGAEQLFVTLGSTGRLVRLDWAALGVDR